MLKHTIRLMLIAALAFVLLGCDLMGSDDEHPDEAHADVAALQDQLASKDAQIAQLQAQVSAQPAATTSRLETVKARGRLVCASRTDVPGYGFLDASGRNVGFDIDLCRAVAAAIFGSGDAMEVIPISAAERGPTIQSGDVDMLARTVTWTTTRDSQWGNYTVVTFYDGQGFMVRKDKNIDSALKLGGTSVCVTSGTTTELNLADYFRQNNMELEAVVFENTAAVVSAYEQGRCDAFTNDKSQLAALKSGLQNPADHVVLPETISKEPLTTVVPHGDDQWLDLVKTVLYVLINAEEFGVTMANVGQMVSHENIQIRRMLGTEGEFGQSDLGLKATFAQDVLKAVGNYGEIYDRYMGPEGLDLERGINELWTNGGLIYAPPLR